MRGTVLQCGKYGCIVRLQDGQFAMLPADEPDIDSVRRAASGGRHPQFAFIIASEHGRRIKLRLATAQEQPAPQAGPAADVALERKIIDYLRQTAEWNPTGAAASREESNERPRANRLLPFELRARRQYRDDPKRPRRPKR